MELAELQNDTSKPLKQVWEEQELANEIQQINVKQNAAASIKEASINMINILKKVCTNKVKLTLFYDNNVMFNWGVNMGCTYTIIYLGLNGLHLLVLCFQYMPF